MNKFQTAQSNNLLHIASGEDLMNAHHLLFIQGDSDLSVSIPINSVAIDCFTANITFDIEENKLPNGIYTVKCMDSDDSEIFTITAEVEGNTDTSRAYIMR